MLADYLCQVVTAVPSVIPLLSVKAKEALLGYPPIRAAYFAEIYDAVEGYLTSDRPTTAFSNSARAAMSEAFTDAAYEGYQNAGAELPLADDVSAWLSERIAAERENITALFERLKEGRGTLDPIAEAMARAEGYTKTLDAMYNEAKMRGTSNATLVFDGDDGAESCPDCQKMKGKRHTIKYILANNLIPKPGNDTYECKGYRCEHFWMNPKTGERFGG